MIGVVPLVVVVPMPASPHDYAATLLHALGIPADTKLPDAANRPHQIYAGKPIEELFS